MQQVEPVRDGDMEIPEVIVFNGVEYRRMGGRRNYYLSQSKSNAGRKGAKGLHVAVWEFYSGQTVPEGYEIHHKDGNPFNNDYSNLECMSRTDHRKATKQDPEKNRRHLEKIRDVVNAWHRSEEGRAWHREHARAIKLEPKIEVVCKCCGKVFLAKKKGAELCSRACQTKDFNRRHVRTEKRICEWCGREFEAGVAYGRNGARTCSRTCRKRLADAERQARRDGLQSDR